MKFQVEFDRLKRLGAGSPPRHQRRVARCHMDVSRPINDCGMYTMARFDERTARDDDVNGRSDVGRTECDGLDRRLRNGVGSVQHL